MIVYIDENFLIATKEQGLLVQGNETSEKSLIDIISKEVNDQVYLINRLDRGVGGLVLFGRNKEATKRLSQIDIDKKYLAVVTGEAKEKDILQDYLLKNQRLNISKVVNKGTKNSKLSLLEYEKRKEILYRDIKLSLLEVTLKTGRHHQIRVQLSSRGIGILGDNKYNRTKIRNVSNIGLWAYKMEFINPFNNEKVLAMSSPEDIFPFELFK